MAKLGEDIMFIAVEMLGKSAGPNIHSFLQSGKERADWGRLLKDCLRTIALEALLSF